LVSFHALQFVLFPIPIVTLFWKDQIGLSLTDIMVLQAVFGLSSVLLEFPSGYLADRIGHRASLLAGAALWVVGWALYASALTFAGVMVAEIVLGAGHAFISGADAALLYASLAANGDTGSYARWEGRVRAAGQMSEAASSAVGGWLYALAPRLPFWLQVPIAVAQVATVAAMRAPRTATPIATSHATHMARIVRYAFTHRRLRTAIGLSVTLGLSTFVMVWLIQPWMQRRGIPAEWFGPIWAAAHLWLAGVSLASARVVETFGRRATLAGCAALAVAGYAALAAVDAAWAVVFYLCFMTTRGLQGPILVSLIQADAPDRDRASVLSLNALCFRLAFVACGPAVGALADRIGLEPALGVLAAVVALASAVALAAFGRAHGPANGRGRSGDDAPPWAP
jgi:predicted MFS family arabinose efflux permease